MSFFAELKRRNVFRVGVTYLLVSWLLVQIIGTITPMLDLPEILGRGIIFMLIGGFPIFLLLAWAYELTHLGIQTQKEVDASDLVRESEGKGFSITIISLLSLSVIIMILDVFVLDDMRPVEPVSTTDQGGAVVDD